MPFLRQDYKRIHYRDSPPDNGSSPRETFVLVHGLGSSQNYYTAVIPSLTAQGFRCISLDTTGQGRSPYTFIEQTLQSLATDVIDVMNALSIQKAVVVGHSMGGLTVPYLAAEWPDRVSAIVLLGPVYPTKEAGELFAKRIDAVENAGMMDPMADTIPWAAVGSAATPIQSAMIRELLMGSDPAGYVSLCRVIASSWKALPAYEKVKCPALIIAGEEDKSAPLAGCQKIQELLGTKEKQLFVMPKIGHWMAVEDPESVGEEIVKFFRQVQ